jgi:hypothetical protein
MHGILLAALLDAPCNAHPVYELKPVVSARRFQASRGGYLATAHLAFRISERTPALIASVDPGLLDHVRGHQLIAQRVSRSSIGNVRATAGTRSAASMRLAQAVLRLTNDAQRELDREEHVYDAVTENGAAQSQGPVYGFPGGPDAHDTCGRPSAP